MLHFVSPDLCKMGRIRHKQDSIKPDSDTNISTQFTLIDWEKRQAKRREKD
jgi:hypothetical protein